MFDFSGIFGVERFKIWCQKVLPTVYDDSLSYMELLCKVLKVLEEYGKGSAEIAEQVVKLAEELEKYKETNDATIGAVSGETAYLGVGVNMEDIPADAVIVGGNGTEEEPYNAFEAGGSKEHGGWVRVGNEVVPESLLNKLKTVGDTFTIDVSGQLGSNYEVPIKLFTGKSYWLANLNGFVGIGSSDNRGIFFCSILAFDNGNPREIEIIQSGQTGIRFVNPVDLEYVSGKLIFTRII